jgi:hypothetical protein
MKYNDNLKRFLTQKQMEEFDIKFPKRLARNNRQNRIEADWLEKQLEQNMKVANTFDYFVKSNITPRNEELITKVQEVIK